MATITTLNAGDNGSTSRETINTNFTNLNTPLNYPEGLLINGKIVPSVTSNNLTVALKTNAGTDPSASDPVYVMIGGTLRSITAALSVTKADATNWFNAGSAELATKEIDYFAYLGYNATDGVVIGFSRIPYATLYSDFSATAGNEKYCGISTITNAVAGDNYVNIGRFAATLSAGAGYTWTVPTFTTSNLIQRPIYETRWLTYTPVATGFSGTPTVVAQRYKIIDTQCFITNGFTGTSNLTTKTTTIPISVGANGAMYSICPIVKDNGTWAASPGVIEYGNSVTALTLYKTIAFGAWTNSGTCDWQFNINYEI